MELLVSPKTPTEPKRYFLEASKRSEPVKSARETCQPGRKRTEETADLVGRLEDNGQLFVVLEVAPPDRESLLVEPENCTHEFENQATRVGDLLRIEPF